ncbi:MAG TPA: serine hydrolase domain-containing protein [Candidatus Angelobacter sp.]|nr:serine hydrolase domain-containing protein [Candidatus Angelobacter sp.]
MLMRTLTVWFLSLAAASFFMLAFARTADDPAQKADQERKVDELLAAFDKPGSPGCSVGAVRNGSFIYKKSVGQASIELSVPLTSESVFYMGSVAKQFTAASVLLAAEQGHLSLDDNVRKYLPELPDYGHPITLRKMLHQTSGFRDFLDLLILSGRDPSENIPSGDVLKLIARQKALNNVPGEEWIYSNSNYFLLGEVVRRATGKSLAVFAAENIFQPLGMAHTLFYDDNSLVVPNRVAAYSPGKNGGFVVDWSTSYALVGGGGLMSTVDDLLLWERNFDSNKLGKGTLVKELLEPGTLNNGSRICYAMGLFLSSYRGLPVVEHDGALFGYRAELLRFPEQRFSVMALCNLSSAAPADLAHKIAEVYLQENFAEAAGESNPSTSWHDPSVFAGAYLDPRTKSIDTFVADHGALFAGGSPLRRVGANKFYDLSGEEISFDNEHGSIQHGSMQHGSMHVSVSMPGQLYFSGDKIQPPQLGASELGRFTGAFHSSDLDATYTLAVRDGRLTVKKQGGSLILLDAVGPNEFHSSEIGTVVFAVNAGHRISGFGLFTDRARRIVFNKVN